MKRREFLNLTMGALALAVVPASVRAEDYRKSKPTVWSAKTVDDAMKALYGTSTIIEKGVKVKAPKVASNGGAVPVNFSADMPIKSIAVFQDANPEAAVVVYEATKYSVNKYAIKIKMAKSGTITVAALGQDGKVYGAKVTLDVALGGCEG